MAQETKTGGGLREPTRRANLGDRARDTPALLSCECLSRAKGAPPNGRGTTPWQAESAHDRANAMNEEAANQALALAREKLDNDDVAGATRR